MHLACCRPALPAEENERLTAVKQPVVIPPQLAQGTRVCAIRINQASQAMEMVSSPWLSSPGSQRICLPRRLACLPAMLALLSSTWEARLLAGACIHALPRCC